MVLAGGSSRPAKDVAVGDSVMSYNPVTNSFHAEIIDAIVINQLGRPVNMTNSLYSGHCSQTCDKTALTTLLDKTFGWQNAGLW